MKHSITGIVTALVFVGGSSADAALFQGLGDLPGGAFSSDATGISADGLVVVGSSSYTYNVFGHSLSEAFRWTQADGMVGLGRLPGQGHFSQSYASAASADGSVIVGGDMRWTEPTGIVLLPDGINARDVSSDGQVIVGSLPVLGGQAFRWTEATGTVGLPYQGHAHGVSGDGLVVVGMHWMPDAGAGGSAPSRWTEAEGTVPLVVGSGSGYGRAASADGSVIVGHFGSYTNPGGAFRWTAADGMVPLGDLPGGGFESAASDVSADGSVVVGFGMTDSGRRAFIWDATNGMRSVQDVLTAQGLDLSGWTLTGSTGAWSRLAAKCSISDDGLTIAGTGINPDGNMEGWIANLSGAVIPEPSALIIWSLLGALGVTVGWWRRRRRAA